MADDDFFLTTGCNIQKNEDGIHVRLNFIRDDDASIRAVVMRRRDVPQLLGALQSEIEHGSVVPIDSGSLQIGADYKISGHQVRKLPDGETQLTLFVELIGKGRTVSLALHLSPDDVSSLVNHLRSS